MDLSPRQRARLQRLLEKELRAALGEARDQGVSPAAMDAALVDRARSLDELLPAGEDRDDASGQDEDDNGTPEQR
jgi:hypothetical protein